MWLGPINGVHLVHNLGVRGITQNINTDRKVPWARLGVEGLVMVCQYTVGVLDRCLVGQRVNKFTRNGGGLALVSDLEFSERNRHSELLSTVAFQNLPVAKIERCKDILDIGHPGVEKRLVEVIRLLEDRLDS